MKKIRLSGRVKFNLIGIVVRCFDALNRALQIGSGTRLMGCR